MNRTHVSSSHITKKEPLILCNLLFVYLFLEYGRPQDLVRVLSYLHLPVITITFLGLVGFFSGKYRFNDKQTKLYLGILALMIIHGPFAVNNYWALMIFITMVYNFVIFLAISNLIDDNEKYRKLVGVWLAVHLFLSIVGIIQKGKGIGGFLGDENDLCMTLNMVLPFPFFLSMCTPGKKRMFFVAFTFLILFAIIVTGSRGGFVGLIATGIYCWVRTKRKAITAFIICILAVFTVLVAPQSYWNRVRTITGDVHSDESKEERIYTWGIGWHMFLENPVMGVGQGNFPYVFEKFEYMVTGSKEPFHGRSVAGRAAHSLYITLLAELGIIGTVLFFSMVLFNIKNLNAVKKRFFKQKTPLRGDEETKTYHIALALEGAMISYMASGAFISVLYYPNFWVLSGFIISLRKISVSTDKPK